MGKNSKRRREEKRLRSKRSDARRALRRAQRSRRDPFPFPSTENYRKAMLALSEERDLEALDLFSKEPISSPCHSMAVGDSAFALLALGRDAEAVDKAREALRLFEVGGCPHPPSIVRFSRVESEALIFQGRYESALRSLEGLEARTHALAREHPESSRDLDIERSAVLLSAGSALMNLRSHESAIQATRAARDICRANKDFFGEIKALINLGHANRLAGNRHAADLAYREADALATTHGFADLALRAAAGTAELGPQASSAQEAFAALAATVDQHTRAHRFRDAFVVAGNWLAEAIERGDEEQGSTAWHRAIELEAQPQQDHDRARLRTWGARLSPARLGGRSRLDVLLEGARFWYASATTPLPRADFARTSASMHDHFRQLSRELIGRGRVPEALFAFEAGRALAHAVQVDRRFLTEVLAGEHFGDGGPTLDRLRAAQRTLRAGDIALSIAVLPPDLVAFVVRSDDVKIVSVPLPCDTDAFVAQLGAVPSRLEGRVGERAIPPEIVRLAEHVCASVGEETVRAIAPHSILHAIPWRAVLRHVGIPWARLACAVEFGILSRAMPGTGLPRPAPNCTALAYGGIPSAGVDFTDEAERFVAPFGDAGRLVRQCTAADVSGALQTTGIVFLSCHGTASPGLFTDGELELLLADGPRRVSTIFPEKIDASLVVLSACESGVYGMTAGDFPVGAAPALLRSGARACVGARFRLDARFSDTFFQALGPALAQSTPLTDAVARVSAQHELLGADLWRQLACLEAFVSAPE